MWSKGYAAQETAAALSRAGELAAQSIDIAESAVVYHAEFFRRFIRGDIASAHEIAEIFHRAAQSGGRSMERRVALRCLALSFVGQGALEQARAHARRALSGDFSEEDVEARRIFGFDHRIAATSYAALTTWLLGDLKEARELIERAVHEGRESAHAVTMVMAYAYWSLIEAIRGDAQAVLGASQTLIQVADQQRMPHYISAARMFSYWAQGSLFDGEAGLTGLRETLAGYLEAGNRFCAPFALALRADLEGMNGRLEDALASADAGLSLAKETREHWSDSHLYRTKGRLLLQCARGDAALAEDAFSSAIEVARRQGARSLSLRAGLSLAKLYRSTGRPNDAHAVLAPALDGFSPTAEMPEIEEAKAVLGQLESGDSRIVSGV
jgi:predicted ATPase